MSLVVQYFQNLTGAPQRYTVLIVFPIPFCALSTNHLTRSSHSSQDATWISTTNTLKCNSPSDIFLLLKSSDFIAHDLDHAFEECYYESEDVSRKLPSDEFELVLRKWYDVAPSMEFRCFVKDNEIVGTYLNSRETS